jgi:hypothetical protein
VGFCHQHRDPTGVESFVHGVSMTDWEHLYVSVAIAAARNCVDVFEKEYPADGRPRKALEAAEQWFREPSVENRQLFERLENQVWRSKDWTHPRAVSAARACGCAARAARHPESSVMDAIKAECHANGSELTEDYARKWLLLVLHKQMRSPSRTVAK